MLYNVEKKNVVSSGEISTRKITLSANAKAFRLLFGQMYPDIKKAIVRELFTNAWDSQKNAGTLDTPIQIHIPTNWEPYFSIRDFGTGMLPSVVDQIYSRIFESTKDASNDEAGMFGMGSKTPLGYGDSFSVTSYVDGTFWYYDIYMDSDASPNISLKATGETDEADGVLVQLGVQEADFEAFKQHTEHFALGANTPIEINRQKYLNKREILKAGDGWQLYKPRNNYEDVDVAQIRMGPVLYRLNMAYMNSYAPSSMYDKRNGISTLLKKPIVMDFDIGVFNVTGSREDIIYDRDSVAKIYDKLAIALDAIRKDAYEDIQNCETYRDAFFKLKEYTELGFGPTKPKYGALPLTQTMDKKKFPGLEFMMNPIKKKRMDRFEPASYLQLYSLYDTSVVMNYFIVVQKDAKVQRLNQRLENLMEHLTARMSYKRNSYSYRNGFNLIYVEYEKKSNLNRLLPFVGPNAIFIELEDIERKINKRGAKVAGSDMAKWVKTSIYGNVEISDSQVEMEDDMYYVETVYSNFEADESIIKSAIKFYNLQPDEKVLCLGKSQRHLVAKYNFVDLVKEFEADRLKIRYNKDTMNKHAYAWAKSDRSLSSNLFDSEEFQSYAMSDYKHDETNVEPDFNYSINEDVKTEFLELVEKIKETYKKFFDSKPILRYISTYELAENFTDVMNTIEEMSK